jgi:hypothetical protein
MGHIWHNAKIMNLHRFMTQSRQINLRSNHGFFDVSFLSNIFKSKKLHLSESITICYNRLKEEGSNSTEDINCISLQKFMLPSMFAYVTAD